jgi:hypothetical protein
VSAPCTPTGVVAVVVRCGRRCAEWFESGAASLSLSLSLSLSFSLSFSLSLTLSLSRSFSLSFFTHYLLSLGEGGLLE